MYREKGKNIHLLYTCGDQLVDEWASIQGVADSEHMKSFGAPNPLPKPAPTRSWLCLKPGQFGLMCAVWANVRIFGVECLHTRDIPDCCVGDGELPQPARRITAQSNEDCLCNALRSSQAPGLPVVEQNVLAHHRKAVTVTPKDLTLLQYLSAKTACPDGVSAA